MNSFVDKIKLVRWNPVQWFMPDCIHFKRFKLRSFDYMLVEYMFGKNKTNTGEISVGVEVGVNRGVHAHTLLVCCDWIDKMYLVDPYTHSNLYGDGCERKQEAYRRLKYFKDNIVWLEKPSIVAVDDVEELVDFVYIDGDHSYDACLNDIESWWDRVKPGGVLGGDDFSVRENGVARAVIEFSLKYNLSICFGLPKDTDWWFFKPEVKEV